MANTRAFGLIDWILLLVVLLVAGAVRAGYLVFLAANRHHDRSPASAGSAGRYRR